MEQQITLIGTEKQIKWAESIREKALVNIEHFKSILASVTEDELPGEKRDAALVALDTIAGETSASVWIDQREWLSGSKDYFDFMFSDLFMKYGAGLPKELRARSRVQ
jgi:hypothetical protein